MTAGCGKERKKNVQIRENIVKCQIKKDIHNIHN